MGFQGRGGCGRGCTSARKSFVAETTEGRVSTRRPGPQEDSSTQRGSGGKDRKEVETAGGDQ